MKQTIFNELFQYDGLRHIVFGFKSEHNVLSKKKNINHIMERLVVRNLDEGYNDTFAGFSDHIRIALRRWGYYVSNAYVLDFIGDKYKYIFLDVKNTCDNEGDTYHDNIVKEKYLLGVSDNTVYDIETEEPIGVCLDGENIIKHFNHYVSFEYDEEYYTPIGLDILNDLLYEIGTWYLEKGSGPQLIEQKNNTSHSIADTTLIEAWDVYGIEAIKYRL